MPVYGDGRQSRDFIYVEDHCAGIETVLERGASGEIYNVGGGNEIENLTTTTRLLELTGRDESHIRYVTDRPGHDRRYALDTSKLQGLGWRPEVTFDEGLQRTVEWYRENRAVVGADQERRRLRRVPAQAVRRRRQVTRRRARLRPTATGGYLDALAVGEFRALFAAYTVSMLGDIVAAVALTVLVFERTGSPFLAGVTFTLAFVPYLFAGALLSSLVDRVPPRRLMIALRPALGRDRRAHGALRGARPAAARAALRARPDLARRRGHAQRARSSSCCRPRPSSRGARSSASSRSRRRSSATAPAAS